MPRSLNFANSWVPALVLPEIFVLKMAPGPCWVSPEYCFTKADENSSLEELFHARPQTEPVSLCMAYFTGVEEPLKLYSIPNKVSMVPLAPLAAPYKTGTENFGVTSTVGMTGSKSQRALQAGAVINWTLDLLSAPRYEFENLGKKSKLRRYLPHLSIPQMCNCRMHL